VRQAADKGLYHLIAVGGKTNLSQRPVDELEAGAAFYSALNLDVSYFGAQWHIFNVGHLLVTDLDRITRRHGISIADLHMLGALRIDRPRPLRATDLALTLHVSNAVLTPRIAKLERKGFLIREPSTEDRRAVTLRLTPEGAQKAVDIVAELGREANFVRYFKRLPKEDCASLTRIMGQLHNMLDKDFVAVFRGKL
jgi:DNA-binding MarR family transcriptional regulator